ncbi:MAG: hypothetical protein V1646_01605 [bacterium]
MQNEENKKIVFGKYCFRIAPDGHFDEDTQENRDELLKTAASEYLIMNYGQQFRRTLS